MGDEEFRALIDAALDSPSSSFKDVTKLQYASQLRNFNRMLGERHPRSVNADVVVSYVDGLTSRWAQRRAVSALSVLYRYLGRVGVAKKLADAGFRRPKRLEYARLAKMLRASDWTRVDLLNLRWSDVRDDLLPSRLVPKRRFRGAVRTAFRSLLCRRYPQTERLLGDGPAATPVFSKDDLPV